MAVRPMTRCLPTSPRLWVLVSISIAGLLLHRVFLDAPGDVPTGWDLLVVLAAVASGLVLVGVFVLRPMLVVVARLDSGDTSWGAYAPFLVSIGFAVLLKHGFAAIG